jgi:RNA polymerase sigma factor (sigma-70 family)
MDAAEFKSLVLPMSKKLLHYAYLLLRDTGEAEDAVQEICLRLWKIRDSLENYNSLEAFAMKVTRNWCLDRLKAKKPVYIDRYTGSHERSTEEGDPQLMLEKKDKIQLLDLLMNKLPEQQRMIIQLRDLEGIEFEMIAEIMDMKVNAVRVNLSRARVRLREEFLTLEANGNRTIKDTPGKVF